MSNQPPPKWLDDQFSVLPTNVVFATNGAQLTPAAGAAATVNAPPITVQKSGNFLVFLFAKTTIAAGAGHKVTFAVSGTDTFVGSYSPSVPAVADTGATNWAIASVMNVDAQNLARGTTVTYSATATPAAGGDSVIVPASGMLLVVVEL